MSTMSPARTSDQARASENVRGSMSSSASPCAGLAGRDEPRAQEECHVLIAEAGRRVVAAEPGNARRPQADLFLALASRRAVRAFADFQRAGR